MRTCTAEINQDNFRRAKKPHWDHGDSHARTCIPLHALVPPGPTHIPARAVRSRDQRPYEGQTDLSAVRVATQIEVYATRLSFCQHLWCVHEQHLKRPLGHATQGPWEVITAVIMGVVQTNKPDGVATMAQFEGLIDSHGDAQAFE